MPKSRLSSFVEKLTAGFKSDSDPFGEDYFDVAEYERRRLSEEPKVIEEALAAAKEKSKVTSSKIEQVQLKNLARGRRHWDEV